MCVFVCVCVCVCVFVNAFNQVLDEGGLMEKMHLTGAEIVEEAQYQAHLHTHAHTRTPKHAHKHTRAPTRFLRKHNIRRANSHTYTFTRVRAHVLTRTQALCLSHTCMHLILKMRHFSSQKCFRKVQGTDMGWQRLVGSFKL